MELMSIFARTGMKADRSFAGSKNSRTLAQGRLMSCSSGPAYFCEAESNRFSSALSSHPRFTARTACLSERAGTRRRKDGVRKPTPKL